MNHDRRLVASSIIVILIPALTACAPTARPTTQLPTALPTTAATAKPTVAPTPPTALITDLVVNDKSTAANWAITSNLQVGDQQFGDRSYAIASLPPAYAASDWIRTAADAKKFIGQALVTFKVTADADVYVAHDDRVVTKPAWFKDWTNTGDRIVNTEPNPVTFSIFKKSFPADSTVTLGDNGASSGVTHYMIFVRRPGQVAVVATPGAKGPSAPRTCKWDACLGMPADWYSSEEAIRIADNLLLYQRDTGGWYKNIDMATVLTDTAKSNLLKEKAKTDDSTIDNNATTSQIQYLARVYAATKMDRFEGGALKGLDYLLEAQYDNGGWPQYYPVDPSRYYARITFNDNAMINVMTLLRDLARDPAYSFVDSDRRAKTEKALQKAIAVILKTQIVVDAKRTAWCQQYDERTLAPAPARSYELESISGQESVGIVRFLMSIDKPSPEVIEAIQSAIQWFDDSKITGIQVIDKPDPMLPGGFDRVVVENPNAPPIWARFYDINTHRPFFAGRDGVKKNTLAEIEHERRVGYAYYTSAPAFLLANDYPAWQPKWAPNANVLKK